MPKALKVVLAAFGALLLLVIAGVIFIAVTFDPNAYKPLLIDTVQKERQRTLAIPGPISLSLFPTLGVKLGAVTLSERRSTEPFASIESAQVSLAVWPLLRREVVVDRLAVAGLRARVVRFKDGKLNIDDLLGGPAANSGAAPSAPPAPPTAATPAFKLDIAGIAVTDAELTFDDRQGARKLRLSKAALQAGRLAPGATTPVSAQARLDADAPALGADIALKGRLVQGPAEGRMAFEDFEATFDGRLGRSAMKARVGGGVVAELAAGKLDARLAGDLDGSRFKATLGMPRLKPAAYTFDIEFDRLDLDRFRSAAASGPATAAAGPEAPLDLTALRDLEATGQLRIGALQLMNLKAGQVRAGVRATGGRVQVAPLAAELYQGKLEGSASVLAAAGPARFGLQQTLEGVALGPLLKDLTGTDVLQGKGTVVLDVTTTGATVGALTKALAGSARVALKDGAVRGVNVAQAIRVARAMSGRGSGAGAGAGASPGVGTAARGEATDFSELSASFRITQGVARNDDLAAKSPLLRLGGSGDIDLGARRLDYTVKATIVSTLEGQGGAELQALRGQTVPVKLSGPFDAITWRIDFGAMLKEAAQAKLDEKREALKEDAKRRLGDKLRDLLRK